MKQIKIDGTLAGKRADKAISAKLPRLPYSVLRRAFRKKDVKVNGSRIDDSFIVKAGDLLEVFISDDLIEGRTEASKPASCNNPGGSRAFGVIYEDANIMIVNKRQGVPVHPDKTGNREDETLIGLLKEHTGGEVHLCHRLDRNTGGLIIAAKNRASLDIITEKMKESEIRKYYQCLVNGSMPEKKGILRAYLQKNEKQSRVYVSENKREGWQEIITGYKVLEFKNNISRLEVELITGRTHQIRAHLAYIGHPVMGDGKYGTNAVNKPLGFKLQALVAYKLVFDFRTPSGQLEYLKGKTFKITPEFVNKPNMP